MPLLFNNPHGFWLLLGIPAVLALHFLQQRSRSLRISTLFLIEEAAPESRSGRTWDRLRNSLALWCQLLAVLLATWVLVEPRWIRPQSTLTVVLVLDDSASMSAFRGQAHRALRKRIDACGGLAERITWVVMSSDQRRLPYYRGLSSADALGSFDRWRPDLATHDITPALRLAHALAGRTGVVWLITDTRDNVPQDQPAEGVGRLLPNVGFAGSAVFSEEGRLQWRAFIHNRSDVRQRRSWRIERGQDTSTERNIDLDPGALIEIAGPFPDGAERCALVLSPDGFPLDDVLPLQRPRPKTLRVSVSLDERTGDYFRRLASSLEGIVLSAPEQARLKIARFASRGPRPAGPAILLHDARDAPKGERIATALRVPVRHPLMADLNWQAWLGPGAEEMTLQEGDQALLWQADAPLVVLGAGKDDSRSLLFNFDWHASNAERLPASVLLVRRFIEQLRDAQQAPFAANFDCGSPVRLAQRDLDHGGEFIIEHQSARHSSVPTRTVIGSAGLPVLTAPAEPGFFSVRRGGEELVRASCQYADPREGDFRHAETFESDLPAARMAVLEKTTEPDPAEKPALLLLLACLLLSWVVPRPRGGDHSAITR